MKHFELLEKMSFISYHKTRVSTLGMAREIKIREFMMKRTSEALAEKISNDFKIERTKVGAGEDEIGFIMNLIVCTPDKLEEYVIQRFEDGENGFSRKFEKKLVLAGYSASDTAKILNTLGLTSFNSLPWTVEEIQDTIEYYEAHPDSKLKE